MSKSMYKLPIVAAVFTASIFAFSWVSAETRWDQESRSRKADYIFLEAQSAYNSALYDKYVTLLERSYDLDSADLDIASEWGLLTLMDENADTASAKKAYTLIKRHFLAFPENYISGVILSNAAQRLGNFKDAVMVWETLDSLFPTRIEIAQNLAEAYTGAFASGDSTAFEKAIAIYNRLERGSGRSVDLTSKKLYTYYLKGDTASVVAELDSLYSYAPNDSYTALFVGANYQYLSMPDSTIKYFDLACQLDSTNGSAYLSRARFYNEQGDSAAFDREVFYALKSQNLDVDSKIGILRSYVSELYTDTTQEPRIRQLFNDLQLMHAGEPQIHSLYGAYLYELDDFQGACEQFSYVVALDPSDKGGWTSYLQTAALANDTAVVYKEAPQAIKRFPQELYFPIILSNVYRINDDNQKALAVLDSVDVKEVKNEVAVSNFLTSKGDLYAVLCDTLKAIETYDKAIELNPDNSMALNNAAYFITLLDGDLDKAERYSAKSLKNDELNPTYLDTYAWVFFKKKDYKMAKNYIDIALNSYAEMNTHEPVPSDSVEALSDIDVIPSDAVGMEEGVETEDQTTNDGPSADIYDHAGDIYFMNGEIEAALEFWKKAAALEPDDAIIQKKVKNKTIFFK